jgi:glycerol uptake facilitator-like aquaporin
MAGDGSDRRRETASASRRLAAEFGGTAFLLMAVVGSGVMGEQLAGGNIAIALLANSVATGAALVAIILAVGDLSGAHLNPAVTLAAAWKDSLHWRDAAGYVVAQFAGAAVGVVVAHAMFGEPLIRAGTHVRSGPGQWLAEGVATFGLIAAIRGCARHRSSSTAFAVGAYITAAYWFTSSTSFANPAVTAARGMTDTFVGIRPVDIPGFIAAQVFGAVVATAVFAWLIPWTPPDD